MFSLFFDRIQEMSGKKFIVNLVRLMLSGGLAE